MLKFRCVLFLPILIMLASPDDSLADRPFKRPAGLPEKDRFLRFRHENDFERRVDVFVDLEEGVIDGQVIDPAPYRPEFPYQATSPERLKNARIYLARAPIRLPESARAELQTEILRLSVSETPSSYGWECGPGGPVSTVCSAPTHPDRECCNDRNPCWFLRLPEPREYSPTVKRVAEIFKKLVPGSPGYIGRRGFTPRNDQPEKRSVRSLWDLLSDAVRPPYGSPESKLHIVLGHSHFDSGGLSVTAGSPLQFDGRFTLQDEEGVTYIDIEKTPLDPARNDRLLNLLKTTFAIEQSKKECPQGEEEAWSRSEQEKGDRPHAIEVWVDEHLRTYRWPQEKWCNVLSSGDFASELRKLFKELNPMRKTYKSKRSETSG